MLHVELHFVSCMALDTHVDRVVQHMLKYICVVAGIEWLLSWNVLTSGDTYCVLTGIGGVWSTQVDMHFMC